ncbi:MAG: G/U mismatch-specific DNA glycosylase [Actinomycetota bacterium]
MNIPPGWKPTKDEIAGAEGRTIEDVIAPHLDVLFCGINPSLYSGATGDHFARPGNRFWPVLHASGFTDRLLHPSEKAELLAHGLGVTNIVMRATVGAADLTDAELRSGVRNLEAKVRKYEPRYLALLGVGAFRTAFELPKAKLGPQDLRLAATKIWVLPNPSGLNAHYQLPALTEMFAELRLAVRAAGDG